MISSVVDNTLTFGLSFVSSLMSLGIFIYMIILNKKMKNMHKKNELFSRYVKRKSFLLMKNDGENPCDTQKVFDIPKFSQKSDYIIGRRFL